MGYLHIKNLYANIDILNFKECYCLEKIHGTSAHINWKSNKLSFFSGGATHSNFINIFNHENLENKFKELFMDKQVTIYGEAYGGKLQGMRETYGGNLKFIVFDVNIDGLWLDVPKAEKISLNFDLEFVDYIRCSTDLEILNQERDKPSTQAIRNGCGNNKLREGIVIRPIIELTKNNNERIISKHKRDEFKETATKREVSFEELKILKDAKEIAEEFVVPMRLNHILDKANNLNNIKDTKKVIDLMIEDIGREAKDEIIMTNAVKSEISKKTAQLFKQKISKIQE